MRKSSILKKLRNREVVVCFKLNLSGGEVAEIAAMLGFNCLWVDRGHVMQDWSDIKAQNWVTKAYDTDLMARMVALKSDTLMV